MKKLLVAIFVCFVLPASAFAAGGTLGLSNNTATLTKGLVGYWSFDGNKTNWLTGTTQDSSGSGNTGSLINMSTTTSLVAGKIGSAFNFNGNDDVGGFASNISPPGTTRSICMWFNTSVSSTIRQELINDRANAGGNGWELNIGQGNVANTLTYMHSGVGGALLSVSTTINSNTWYHTCATYNATTLVANVYKNGQLVGSLGSFNPDTGGLAGGGTSGTIGSGGCAAGLCPVFGKIDDVRIYNRVLSAQEVQQLYTAGLATVDHSNTTTLQSGLAGYWPLDGNTTNWNIGATIDASGNGNLGQLINMATSSSPTAGKIGGALNFNGTNSRITGSGSNLPIGTTQPFSISAWVNIKVTSGAGYVFEFGNSGDTGDPLLINIAGLWRFGIYGGCNLDNANAADVNHWVHLAGTFDGTNERLYKNGSLVVGPTACSPNTSAQNFSIGSQISGASPFNGAIDDVRVYNRALSAQEVKQLYGTGVATVDHSITTTSSQNGLLSYYTFDGPNINWRVASSVVDSSGNNNNGQTVNMATSSSPTAGKIGQGLKFTGSATSYVLTPSLGTPPVNMSEAVWIKPNAAGGVVMDELGNPTNVSLWHDSQIEVETNNTIKVCVWTGATTCATAASGITYGNWYHVVLTYNNATQVLSGYTNGTLGGSTTGVARQAPNTSIQAFGIGLADSTSAGNPNAFSGVIDDVRVYSTTLSASDVAKLYQLGR